MEIYIDDILPGTVSAPPVARRAAAAPAVVRAPTLPFSRWATIASFAVADLAAFAVAIGTLYLVFSRLQAPVSDLLLLIPVMGLLIVAYAFSGLYNAVAMHPAQELRSVAVRTTVMFMAYTFTILLAGAGGGALWKGLLLAWFLTLVLVLVSRALARVLFARASWWGLPAVVLTSNGAGEAVLGTLERWPEIGLRPVAVLHDDFHGAGLDHRLALEMTRLAPLLATTHKVPYVIVAMPDLNPRRLINLIRRCSKFFRHVLVVPDVPGASALWTSRHSCTALLGYDVQYAARSKGGLFVKRVLDLLGALAGILVLTPLLITIGVLIKFDSPGPILFRQLRMTQGGRCFKVFKFRTMHLDAEERLQTLLEENPAMREEYEQFHKLRDDPRITRVGKVLRRASLDELPQLWNVLLGQLSLVGPRAYMPNELSKMGGFEHVVLQIRPGITGLWQVSGRNAVSFEDRVQMDVHYIHNWTPWLDLHLLAKTIPVVLTGDGAA